jgi:beta-fructofuranosidase
MSIFYKPADGWAADCIPFFWQGEYHLFYLKDYRDEAGHGPGTPWFHLGTRDFVHFTDYGEALPRGGRDDQDLFVFTGCVIEHAGLFHIYYTGHNPLFKEQGRPIQAIMHATSPDLVHWTKDPANPILYADPTRYEPDDWRDPFVFWNEEAGEFWMLLAARLCRGPSQRRGCIALATSPDLARWTVRDPFWSPSLYYTHECPDLFRLGEWWYLVYSTFSERHLTHYRMSRTLAGPWLAPADDAFDGRAFYAAKTASDGTRRFAFGWNPTRAGEADAGAWQWGGNLVVHEVVPRADGSLSVRPPATIAQHFKRPLALGVRPEIGRWEIHGDALTAHAVDRFAWCRLGPLPETCRIDVTIACDAATRGCGLLLRVDDAGEAYYQVRLEPGRQRLVFDRWPRPGDEPFMLERPLPLAEGQETRLQVYVEGSVIEIYANDQTALSARGYDHPSGAWGAFVSEGTATFREIALTIPSSGEGEGRLPT